MVLRIVECTYSLVTRLPKYTFPPCSSVFNFLQDGFTTFFFFPRSCFFSLLSCGIKINVAPTDKAYEELAVVSAKNSRMHSQPWIAERRSHMRLSPSLTPFRCADPQYNRKIRTDNAIKNRYYSTMRRLQRQAVRKGGPGAIPTVNFEG